MRLASLILFWFVALGGPLSIGLPIAASAAGDPPVAQDFNVETEADTKIRIPVLKGEKGGPFTINAPTQPRHGQLAYATNNNKFITYMPDLRYVGRDSFTYTLQNANGISAPGKVSVDVVLDPPKAADVMQNAASETLTSVKLPYKLDFIFDKIKTTKPAHGTVENYGTSISYVSDHDWQGPDTFYYTVYNKAGSSNQATVTMNVLPPRPNRYRVVVSVDQPGIHAMALAVDPAKASAILMGGERRALLRSADFGASWQPVSWSAGASSTWSTESFAATALLADGSGLALSDGGNVGTPGALYRSPRPGAPFGAVTGFPAPNSTRVAGTVGAAGTALATLNGTGTVYAADRFVGIEKSLDGGRHWTDVTPLHADQRGIDRYDRLAFDPGQPQQVYAIDARVTAPILFGSVDGGASWTQIKGFAADFAPRAVLATGQRGLLFVSGASGSEGSPLYCSTDHGTTWTPVLTEGTPAETLAITGAAGTSTLLQGGTGGLAMLSATACQAGLAATPITAGIGSHNPALVLAPDYSNSVAYAGNPQGLAISGTYPPYSAIWKPAKGVPRAPVTSLSLSGSGTYFTIGGTLWDWDLSLGLTQLYSPLAEKNVTASVLVAFSGDAGIYLTDSATHLFFSDVATEWGPQRTLPAGLHFNPLLRAPMVSLPDDNGILVASAVDATGEPKVLVSLDHGLKFAGKLDHAGYALTRAGFGDTLYATGVDGNGNGVLWQSKTKARGWEKLPQYPFTPIWSPTSQLAGEAGSLLTVIAGDPANIVAGVPQPAVFYSDDGIFWGRVSNQKLADALATGQARIYAADVGFLVASPYGLLEFLEP